ncbi:ead/Ea22-like family protein [Enterobacter rongchengensis]|uniref:ead/Ea22-like family protein n=1 Tax=Enterobacter rongchengensis TaxID=3030999 RepID=UPI003B4331EC
MAEGTQLDADITALNALNSTANPATVLALLDELEAAEKRIAELEARDKPKLVQCWSCKHDIEVLAIADCDGYCPRCAAPINLDDEPYAAAGKGEAS